MEQGKEFSFARKSSEEKFFKVYIGSGFTEKMTIKPSTWVGNLHTVLARGSGNSNKSKFHMPEGLPEEGMLKIQIDRS